MKLAETGEEEMALHTEERARLPFALKAVAHARSKGYSGAGNISGGKLHDLADWIRTCMPKELETLFEAAAVLRLFDRRSLAAVTGAEQTARGFEDLL